MKKHEVENFHFTQRQQNYIGCALRRFIKRFETEEQSASAISQGRLSSLLEDLLLHAEVEDIEKGASGTLYVHADTVRRFRELVQDLTDPEIVQALNSTIKAA